ncbi:MAG TPA: hypothetical protein HA362_03545 [Nanoarchaeota archaeon]|nr:hypothetical protein [Nanoarchaeota archaeon]
MSFEVFAGKFTGKNPDYVKMGSKYFLAGPLLVALSKQLGHSIVSLGLFLGEEKAGKFMPSLALLEILSVASEEKVFVNGIGEIDFLYNKGLKSRHIVAVKGSSKEGFMKLIQNEHDENLGYGKISRELGSDKAEIANLLDRGDFIRREKD